LISLAQRVLEAKVHIENKEFSSIGSGLLVLICIEDSDTNESIAKMSKKLLNFKMIDGSKGITSCSLKDTKEEVLIVSQFTLSAITNKGNKPTFHKAAKPDKAKLMYDKFVDLFKKEHQFVKEGKFGASMNISSINKGPVTFNFKT
jgi:D-tyrosyl-tRNA(Tyr) deacylase